MLPTPFAEAVLDVVAAVPRGRVTTYGDVAAAVGRDGGARAVGTVLARYGGGVPWHRVVRADGSPAAGHEAAALARLRAEGVPLRDARVDLGRARWRPVSEGRAVLDDAEPHRGRPPGGRGGRG